MGVYMNAIDLGIAVFIVLNGVDILFTHAVLSVGGKEFNPVVRRIYHYFGFKGVAVFKGLILSGLCSLSNHGVLDLWSIWYLNFSFSVILILMAADLFNSHTRIMGIPITTAPKI